MGEKIPGWGLRHMKILVTGACGQLGHDCVNEIISRGNTAVGSDIQSVYSGIADGSAVTTAPYVRMDITDEEEVLSVVCNLKPDAIIHCAAWTNVDGAEDEENRGKVFAINAKGTRNLAEAAKMIDAKMLYISTDYVFKGEGETPWDPDDKSFEPLNVYGESKLEGEKAVSGILDKFFVVRIAWVFGLNGKNFIKTMIKISEGRDEVRVVSDQIGTPTYTLDLSRLLADMIETDKYGFYHATNSEVEPGAYISWYDFCCEIYRQKNISTKVIPVSTSEYGLSKAARPKNSRLDKSKLEKNGFKPLPVWTDAVKRFLESELEQ